MRYLLRLRLVVFQEAPCSCCLQGVQPVPAGPQHNRRGVRVETMCWLLASQRAHWARVGQFLNQGVGILVDILPRYCPVCAPGSQ